MRKPLNSRARKERATALLPASSVAHEHNAGGAVHRALSEKVLEVLDGDLLSLRLAELPRLAHRVFPSCARASELGMTGKRVASAPSLTLCRCPQSVSTPFALGLSCVTEIRARELAPAAR